MPGAHGESMRAQVAYRVSAVVLMVLNLSQPGLAEDQAQSEATVSLYVADARLQDVLATLQGLHGQRIDMSDSVRGRVIDRRLDGTLEDALDALSQDNGMEWFAFNGVYYVSLQSEATSRVVAIRDLDRQTVRDTIASAGLDASALRILESEESGSLILTGPPKLVAFSEVVVENIPAATDPPSANFGVRIRRAGYLAFENIPNFEGSKTDRVQTQDLGIPDGKTPAE